MESDPWAVRYSSRRHPTSFQSRSDLYFGFEEIDGEEDSKAEFPCPFCSDDFDIVGLCCHIDEEHPVEAKNGVCPLCQARVGVGLVGHITRQHGQLFKSQRRRRLRKGSVGSHSTFSLLRRELREGHLQSLLGGSSCVVPSSNAAPDPLLSSFIYNLPVADAPKNVQTDSLNEGSSKKSEKVLESTQPSLSDKEQKEKAERCEFVQELLLSTFLDEVL